MHSTRSRSIRSNSEKDSPRFLDRNSLSDSRRKSSSNGSSKHPYSSFTRSHRERNHDREKEKSLSEDILEHYSSDPFASISSSRIDRSAFKRSQSLVSRKAGEVLPRRIEDSRNSISSQSSSNEVPSILADGMDHSYFQQNVARFPTSASGASCTAGLNMAEALSQPPPQVRTTPQLPDKIQRLEELAIKQSKQLIPVTPSTPKPSGPGSGDKSKQPRIAVRTGEMIVASKGRDNGVTIVTKDAATSTGDANCRLLNGQLPVAPSKAASMSLNNSMVPALGNKVAALSLSSRSTVDKRSSQSLAQSRSEFFKLMRRKTTHNATTSHSDSSSAVSSPSAQTSGEINRKGHTPIRPCHLENGTQMICNGNGHDIPENSHKSSDVGGNNSFVNGAICPDEEEAAFLRSLGWEENGGEDEGLTEEEVNAFYKEVRRAKMMTGPWMSMDNKLLASGIDAGRKRVRSIHPKDGLG
ncbi:UNVERIFIED_CONTAM: hypothetical protein Sangu_1956000 [Sesamum angustifolium]|uniref:Uncharacterized protein n=1 Tax=Sesamum angustifolium TaxID=2727405 RepID=A0AAW2LYY3_9LAMI